MTNCSKGQQKLIDTLYPMVEDVVDSEGMELVDVVYRREPHGWVVRLLIDKEGGVTIDDCSLISSQVSDLLDVKDIIPHGYKLEVSSPGVNRPLKRAKDYMKHKGETVRVKTAAPIENRKNFKGRLIDYADGMVHLDIGDSVICIPHANVSKAHVEYNFNKPTKQKG